MSHVLRQDGPSLDSTWPFKGLYALNSIDSTASVLDMMHGFTQQERRLTNITSNQMFILVFFA